MVRKRNGYINVIHCRSVIVIPGTEEEEVPWQVPWNEGWDGFVMNGSHVTSTECALNVMTCNVNIII